MELRRLGEELQRKADLGEARGPAFDCHWVGSDFDFVGNQVGFSTKPTKS